MMTLAINEPSLLGGGSPNSPLEPPSKDGPAVRRIRNAILRAGDSNDWERRYTEQRRFNLSRNTFLE